MLTIYMLKLLVNRSRENKIVKKLLKKKQKKCCFCQTSFKRLYIMQIFFIFFYINPYLAVNLDTRLLITIKS